MLQIKRLQFNINIPPPLAPGGGAGYPPGGGAWPGYETGGGAWPG